MPPRWWENANVSQRIVAVAVSLYEASIALMLLAAYSASGRSGAAALGFGGLFLLITTLAVIVGGLVWVGVR